MSEFKNRVYCGSIDTQSVGKRVTLTGWAARCRNLGAMIFIDLRDREGIIQTVFNASTDQFGQAAKIRNEFVLLITGTVRHRGTDINAKIKTGAVEVLVESYKILSDSDVLPFMIEDAAAVNDLLRLKYRYLELRSKHLQEIMIKRSEMMQTARKYLADNGFLEIETPVLGKSTPEGARDYLVPSRINAGTFYALPQSPQLYKQLLMISGYDRYFQLARCFRDEDLRANRQPEFTQIDLEMSFVDREDVMEMTYGLIKTLFDTCADKKLPDSIPRLSYKDAMERFGSDKPDTRFGLELTDISDIVKNCEFSVFSNALSCGGSVRAINAKGFYNSQNPVLSRRDIDALTEFVKTYRAKGLLWMGLREDAVTSTLTKFLSKEQIDAIITRTEAKNGDIIFICADTDETVFAALGALRLSLARKGGLIDAERTDVLWVTDFPMFEWNGEENRFEAKHHPFTAPVDEDIPLLDTDPSKVRAKAYDLVINGEEAGGGSIRIHRRELQSKIFNILGFTDEQIQQRFGFFVNAFNYGTPPHGGLAFGFDRLVMMLTGTDDIRDVIAFPKIQNASDLMTEAPSAVDKKQLDELSITLKK